MRIRALDGEIKLLQVLSEERREEILQPVEETTASDTPAGVPDDREAENGG